VKIAAFSLPGSTQERLGVVINDGRLVDLVAAAPGIGDFLDLPAFLRGGDAAIARARDLVAAGKAVRAVEDVRLRAPLSRPGKVLAAGLNYEDHRAETGAATERPPYPEGFVKLASSIIGPGDPIVAWPEVTQLDYEGELAVVIGRTAHNVPAEEALDYVAGYTAVNDVSARDWQMSERSRGRSPLMGKNFPSFCPMGPWMVLGDEIHDPQVLRLELRVNGQVRQSGSTADMIFTVSEMVAHWSRLRLEPGDLILTGTPAGVAMGRRPDPTAFWLKPGDVVEVEVEHVGVLRNTVVAPARER
jgi:2-keto-4-pentenoate hydratase/2-oxohepta-3-ene-1,7-dioic acid hydratase in catechol pathway